MKSILIVARESYMRQIKSWAFFFTVLSPFLFIGLTSGIGFLTSTLSQKEQVAIVTENKVIEKALQGTSYFSFEYKTLSKAKKALSDEHIVAYVVVNDDQGKIKATYYGDISMEEPEKRELLSALEKAQFSLNQQSAGLTQEQIATLHQKMTFSEHISKRKEDAKEAKEILFISLVTILYFIILVYASTTAQDTATEKGAHIMEIIFSSIPATHYFYGKILGILGVIFTHLGIYILGGLAIYANLGKLGLQYNSLIINMFANFDWIIFFFMLFGILSYVIFSAMLGAFVTRVEDVNRSVTPIMLLVMFSFITAMSFIRAGDIVFLKIGSYIPMLSSFYMPIRLINGYASSFEAICSLIIFIIFLVSITYYIGRSYASLTLQMEDLSLSERLKRALRA